MKINGADPDFHRRDLWEAIDGGDFPEWTLAVQAFTEAEANAFGFDVLDPTKLIPEEIIPLRAVGRMVLDRNPDNFFAETEQVAFCTANIVPGIDFTNDPLLQGRLFSYQDTQLKRLGGPNSHQIPINQPKCPFQTLQRDGHMQMAAPQGQVNYEPSSLDPRAPHECSGSGYRTFPAAEAGDQLRVRPESFADHYTQARMFFASQTGPEQNHIVSALVFELSKCVVPRVRLAVLSRLVHIDEAMAARVARGLGVTGQIAPAKVSVEAHDMATSPMLSILSKATPSLRSRKIGCLVNNGADAEIVAALSSAATKAGAKVEFIASTIAEVILSDGRALSVKHRTDGGPSILFDAVTLILSTAGGAEMAREAAAVNWLRDAYAHLKVIAYTAGAGPLFAKAGLTSDDTATDAGLIALSRSTVANFIDVASNGRIWAREPSVRTVL